MNARVGMTSLLTSSSPFTTQQQQRLHQRNIQLYPTIQNNNNNMRQQYQISSRKYSNSWILLSWILYIYSYSWVVSCGCCSSIKTIHDQQQQRRLSSVLLHSIMKRTTTNTNDINHHRNYDTNTFVTSPEMMMTMFAAFAFPSKRMTRRLLYQQQHQSTHTKSISLNPLLQPYNIKSNVPQYRIRCRSTTNNNNNNNNNVGGYDPSEGIEVSERMKDKINVGNPQKVQVQEKEFSVTSILKELAAIQQQGPQKYCILGTRHCSYLHQQIIELLAYALVLSENHVYTSGSSGTNAATIRGALRAERPDLLTVVLPQCMMKQTEESQQLLKQVKDVVEMPQNNDLSLDIASRICNSYLLSLTDQLISFAFHESTTVIEASKEAKKLNKLVTVLYLD